MVTTLLCVLSDLIISAVDSGELAVLSLRDMTAAFDTVDHDILLQRLYGIYGIRGTAHKWFFSLSIRPIINGLSSHEESLRFRVPQGSVLEPLLFFLCTGELEMIIRTCGLLSHSYADDNQIFSSCKTDQTPSLKNRTTICIEEVTNEMSASHLKLNPAKTKFVGGITQKTWCY